LPTLTALAKKKINLGEFSQRSMNIVRSHSRSPVNVVHCVHRQEDDTPKLAHWRISFS
jgi:hypothetical protein